MHVDWEDGKVQVDDFKARGKTAKIVMEDRKEKENHLSELHPDMTPGCPRYSTSRFDTREWKRARRES